MGAPKTAENNKKTAGLPARLEEHKWRPGQTGNAGGRPRKQPITDVLRKMLDEVVANDNKKRTYGQVLGEQLFILALKGNRSLEAIREILDRVEGKAMQRNEVSGPDGGAVVFDTPGSREEVERRIAELLGGSAPKKKT